MQKETIDSYNRGAEELSKKFNEIGPRRGDIERGFSFIKKENPKTIELGCGNGRDAKVILEFTNDYLGIDASEEMVRLSKEYNPEAKFLLADMETFEFPENTDIIFAFASLLHLDKQAIEKVLNKTYEKLSPGGIFYLTVKKDKYQQKIKEDNFGKRTFYFYELSDFEELARDTGYTLIHHSFDTQKGVDWMQIALRK